MKPFTWRTESDDPAPTALEPVDDALSADAALRRVRAGEVLLHTGDFHNAKQLLAAMGRRLTTPRVSGTAAHAFRAERQARLLEHRTLGNVVVRLDAHYRLALRRAPDVALACEQVWGPPPDTDTVVSLKTLLGMLGAAQWRARGLKVPGLRGLLRPHYGVYSPTRTEYVGLLDTLGDVRGRRVIELGTGIGVLSFILLQRGASSVVATDVEPRAVACATENAAALGLADRFAVSLRDGYPDWTADVVLCNPPWLPEAPKSRFDRAVFDDDSRFLQLFLTGLAAHLTPGGVGALVISDLAERLGLRPEGWLQAQFSSAGLAIVRQASAPAAHGRAHDPADPLHTARSQERTTLFVLAPQR